MWRRPTGVPAVLAGRARCSVPGVDPYPSIPMRLRAALPAAIAAAVLTTPAAAQPACVAGTFASYRALGAQGCTIAGVRVSSFDLTFSTRGGGTAPDVILTPFAEAGAGSTQLIGFQAAYGPPLALTQVAGTPEQVTFGCRQAGDGTPG